MAARWMWSVSMERWWNGSSFPSRKKALEAAKENLKFSTDRLEVFFYTGKVVWSQIEWDRPEALVSVRRHRMPRKEEANEEG